MSLDGPALNGSGVPKSPASFATLLALLVKSPTLFTAKEARLAFEHLATPDAYLPSQAGAFLTALRLHQLDTRPDIIAAAATVMRNHAISVTPSSRPEPACDIVGTGGDGKNTFNVSTSAAIVAAAAGALVYKHGNRASTSTSGSADLLVALEVPVTSPHLSPAESPFQFLFAPHFHPSMAPLAPIRRSLGFPTIFNLLGPLINPARPKRMIVGVYTSALGETFAMALREMGVEEACVVCGHEGLDEISTEHPTDVWYLNKAGDIRHRVVTPETFGLKRHPLTVVAGGTAIDNAQFLTNLLEGRIAQDDPIENFVVMNASLLLVVAGIARDERDGVDKAREAIKSGRANELLREYRALVSQSVARSVVA